MSYPDEMDEPMVKVEVTEGEFDLLCWSMQLLVESLGEEAAETSVEEDQNVLIRLSNQVEGLREKIMNSQLSSEFGDIENLKRAN
jgi:hypothetical protein